MNRIRVTDGAPCLGVTKLIQTMAAGNGAGNALVVPDFASVSKRKIGKVTDLSDHINGLVDGLIAQVCECEERGLNAIELDGSPISYINYARFYGLNIRREVILRVGQLIDLTAPITRVRLLRPDNTFIVPRALQIVRPHEYGDYEAELYRTYCQFYGIEKVDTLYVGSPNF